MLCPSSHGQHGATRSSLRIKPDMTAGCHTEAGMTNELYERFTGNDITNHLLMVRMSSTKHIRYIRRSSKEKVMGESRIFIVTLGIPKLIIRFANDWMPNFPFWYLR